MCFDHVLKECVIGNILKQPPSLCRLLDVLIILCFNYRRCIAAPRVMAVRQRLSGGTMQIGSQACTFVTLIVHEHHSSISTFLITLLCT